MVTNDVLSAVADPTRRKILEKLALDGPQPVAILNEPFEMSAPAVSQHLKVLRDNGLVSVQKQAQKRIYTINRKKVGDIEAWAKMLAGEAPPAGALPGFMAQRAAKMGR